MVVVLSIHLDNISALHRLRKTAVNYVAVQVECIGYAGRNYQIAVICINLVNNISIQPEINTPCQYFFQVIPGTDAISGMVVDSSD